MRDAEPLTIEAEQKFQELLTFSVQKTCQLLGNISRSTLWRLVRDGVLPMPLTVTPGRKAFRAIDIEEYLTARRNAAAAEYRVTQAKRDATIARRKAERDAESK